MPNKTNTLRSILLNSAYFVVILAVSLLFTTLGLTRRINSYDANRQDLFLRVLKKDVGVSNSISAQVKEIFVVEGQGVKKGDVLMTLEDSVSEAKLKSLDSVASTNISALTEANVLRAQAGYYTILSPDTGVIYSIAVTEGSYLTHSEPIISIFSDTDVKLSGLFTDNEYAELSKEKRLDVYSSRLEQVFEVEFYGVSKVIEGSGSEPRYELLFTFSRPEDAAALIQGEQLSIVAKTRDPIASRPEEMIKNFWNSFILGPNEVVGKKN